jgi:hypothetical protein
LAVDGLPPDVSASASPNPAMGTSTLTVTASPAALPGRHVLTVVGSSGGLMHASAPVTLVIHGKGEPACAQARPPSADCGEPTRATVRVSADEVVRALHNASGSEPNIAVSSLRIGQVIDANLEKAAATRRYQRLFGRFTVYVAARRSLARAGGDVRWRQLPGNAWLAVKRYGRNVVLSWPAPASGPMLDRRWRRLDRVLRSVVAG